MSIELTDWGGLPHFNPSQYTVLVVDDSSFQRKQIEDKVAGQGYKVTACSTGQECLEFLRESIPDLILMDMTMPGLDGSSTCRMIRENKNTALVPIIFLSSNTDVGTKLAAFDSGGSDYVQKNAPDSELFVRIRNQIQFSKVTQLLKVTLDQSKSLLHVVHHDLCNYQAAISGCFELLKFSLEGQDLGEKTVKNISRMEHCIQVTNRFLRDLRQYDAIKSGNVTLKIESVRLGDLLHEAQLVFEQSLNDKNLQLDVDSLQLDACVKVDPWWFGLSVLNNILSNAIKFSFPGSKIELRSKDYDDLIRVDVIDHGVGMDEKSIQQILDGEKYLTTNGTLGERGTGFGVRMANRLMQAHGGSLTIYSNLKTDKSNWHGTRVTLIVPKADFCESKLPANALMPATA